MNIIRQTRPVVVVSDILMPKMDGYELCKQIKSDKNLRQIPVILLTTLSDPQDVIRGLEAGADNFISKPFDENYLLSQIHHLLENPIPREPERLPDATIVFDGRKYNINSNRLQILNLLLSTYETAIRKNKELSRVQGELVMLNEQLARQLHILEQVQVLVKDIDGKIVFWNEGAETMYGYSKEEAIGQVSHILLKTVFPKPLSEIEHEVWQKGKWEGELIHIRKDGQKVTVLSQWTPHYDANAHREAIIESNSDITERKQDEETIRRAKEEWELTFNSDPDLIAILDCQHRVIRANKAMADRLGVTPENCVGLHCYQVIHGLPAPPDFCPHSLTCRDGKEHMVDVHEPRLGGEFLVSTTPMFDNHGNITGSVHVARDITSLKRAEEALKTNNERLKILSETNSLLLSAENPEKIVQTIASKVMVHLNCDCFFNFIADESAGKLRLNAYAGIPEETAKGISWLNFGEAICGCAARDGCRIISENIQENGDMRAALVRSFGVQAYAAHPLRIGLKTVGTLSFGTRSRTHFNEDELDLMLTIAAQVSIAMERKLNEESLRQYATELEAANKELEAFSYSVSHDLRAPLRSMDGFADILLEDYADKLDDQGKEYLSRIHSSSKLMSQLIDDILALSRITRATFDADNVNLSTLAEEVARELKRTQPERKVEFNIAPDMEAQGDRNLLKLVMQNLLGNAFKFTGKSDQPVIEFGMREIDGKSAYFVRDNGAGFDMAYAEKLFKPFQRLHSASEFPGTGIGLASVQRIINRHGGRVWAEGEKGKGATFYFTLGQ